MADGQRTGEILSIRHLSKSFAGTQALDDVDLEIDAGEVHALLGQNGSGKSTLIKILSGYHAPDGGGSIVVHGESVKLPIVPRDSRRLGISFMHQDLGLVETMSVLENLRVGRLETGAGWHVRWRSERAHARELLRRFELRIDPRAPVSSLSQTEKSIMGIMRALQDVEQTRVAGLLVLDEPTVSLPEDEVHRLFDAIRRVTASGSSVLFVSHRLDEVLEISDRVSVLRDGRLVARSETAELDERALIELILGRSLGEMYPSLEHRTAEGIVEVKGLSGAIVRDASLTLHRGEVLGVTGLIGAGHDELPYLIYGARNVEAGSVEMHGEPLGSLNPGRCKRAGLALLPADRQRQAGIMGATVRENVTLPSLYDYRRRFGLDHGGERSVVRQVLKDFNVQPPAPGRKLATLSGGNQQKTLLGRWIHMRPDVLMLHEPTQGVDVGSRKSIFEILRDAAAGGMSIVYASAEYEDLANLCDRVLVFRNGRIVAELRGDALTHDNIVAQCYASNGPTVNGSAHR